MDVFLANEQEITVDETRITSLARHALDAEDVDDEAELSILFVTPEHIRQLNARFAGDDYATDVLAFPLMEGNEDDSWMLGDVVVCPEIAGENATRLGHPLSHEIETVVVHGILHLLGYDHQGPEDKKRMDDRVAELIGAFRPSPA
jgi:probable rRNA maturation factor